MWSFCLVMYKWWLIILIHSFKANFELYICCLFVYYSDTIWVGFALVVLFNATFNNISVILWWSVLLVKATGVPWENHRPVASLWQICCIENIYIYIIMIFSYDVDNILSDRAVMVEVRFNYPLKTYRNVSGMVHFSYSLPH